MANIETRKREIELLHAFEKAALIQALADRWITEEQFSVAWGNLLDWRELLERDYEAFKGNPPRLPGWH